MGAFRQYNLGTFWSNYFYFRKNVRVLLVKYYFAKMLGCRTGCCSVDKIAGCFDPLTLQKTTRPEWSQYSKFVATYIINLFCFMVSWLQAILEGFHKKGGIFNFSPSSLPSTVFSCRLSILYWKSAHWQHLYIK